MNPIIATGDLIFKQDPELLGEFVGGVLLGESIKGIRENGFGAGVKREAISSGIPKAKKFKYSIDGQTYPEAVRYPNVTSKITRDASEVALYKKSLQNNWEYARYDRRFWFKKTITDKSPLSVSPPPGARNVLHTHPDDLGLPSPGDMDALLNYPVGTVEGVLGRAFPHADAVLRKAGLPESGLVMKTTYCR